MTPQRSSDKQDAEDEEKFKNGLGVEKDWELDIASFTDAKSLYDTLSQEQYTGAEKRAALGVCVCVIRDSLDALGGKEKRDGYHTIRTQSIV